MPGAIIHTAIASAVIEKLGADAQSDIDFNHSVYRKAFLSGALAPDLGAFPGTTEALSNLSHYVRSGALTSALLSLAQDPEEYAFAAGWLTHYLADVAIHPLINRAVGESLYRDPAREVAWGEDPHEHVRIEQGLDGDFYYRSGVGEIILEDAVPPGFGCGLLQRAYREVYGVTYPLPLFEKSLVRSLCYHRKLVALALIRFAGVYKADVPRHYRSARWTLQLPAKLLATFQGANSTYHALVHSRIPSPWLVDQSLQAIQAVIGLSIARMRQKDFAFEDLNLDTGHLAADDTWYEPLLKARRELQSALR